MPFISASVTGIMFVVGKFPGNESFENEIASLFNLRMYEMKLR